MFQRASFSSALPSVLLSGNEMSHCAAFQNYNRLLNFGSYSTALSNPQNTRTKMKDPKDAREKNIILRVLKYIALIIIGIVVIRAAWALCWWLSGVILKLDDLYMR